MTARRKSSVVRRRDIGGRPVRFTVSDMKRMAEAVRTLGTREGKSLSAMLHREQPEFCRIIDEVGMDPRCFEAHRFCTLFCVLTLRHAKAVTGRRLRGIPILTFWDWARRLSRNRRARIGDRASGYPRRIRRHALLAGEFDEEDAPWLCTTLSAFLLVVEGSHERDRGQLPSCEHGSARKRQKPILERSP